MTDAERQQGPQERLPRASAGDLDGWDHRPRWQNLIPISPGAFNNGSGEWTCLHGIKVSISRWIDDHQPGWVECELSDATGVMHRFHEKAPVVTGAQLGPLSQFPQPGVIDCMIVGRRRAPDGREVVSVDTSLPWGIKSTGGQSLFDVHASGLVDLGTSEAEDGG